jgi:predicted permease
MFSNLLYRLRALFRRTSMEADLDQELRAHFERQVDKYVRSGLSHEEAFRRARLEFGGLDRVKEECRDARGVNVIETTIQDLRYGLRMLRKNPGFTAVAVMTLALGIGANTAIFSLLDSVMLRFLPVEKPEELVQIMRRSPRRGNEAVSSFTNPIWEQLRDRQDVFAGAFGWGHAQFDLARGGEAHYAKGLWVTGDFFQTLGVRPAAGRLINKTDDQRGCTGVAVLSYSFWQEHFGGAESALGSTISLDNHTYPIIGVAAPGFYGVEVGAKFDVALPVCATAVFDGARSRLDHRSWWWLHVMGRVKPGISPDQAKAHLDVIAPRIFAATVPPNWDPDGQKEYLKWSLMAVPAATGTSGLRGQIGQPLNILMTVVGMVLLIACANIASLMLGRSVTRDREIAVRRALGASRLRLIRQLLTECILLSTAGALLGILFARWGSLLLVRFISTTGNPVFLDLSLGWRTLGFTAAIAIVTGLLFGVLPSFRSTRVSLTAAMKGGPAMDTEHHVRLHPGRWIVASQIALSLVVLVAAGLLLRTFVKLVTLDIGFDRTNVLMMHTEARTAGIPPERWMATWDEIERRLSSLPGVVSVSRSIMTPISGNEWNQLLHADSPNSPVGDASLAYLNSVSLGYFITLRIPLLAGRDFNTRDSPTAPKVAIINQTVARKFYPNLNPVGRFFRLGEEQGKLGESIQVVGVVGDSKYESLREETYPCAYFPVSQAPGFGGGPNYMIRTSVRPSAVLSLIQGSVAEVDKSISLEFNTLARQVDDSLVQERVLATLSCFFGGLALLLATIGLYGAVSYMVTQRQTEFGIRMALGAAPGSILRLVLSDVVAILAAGVAVGTGISLLSVKLLQRFLFGLAARDTLTLSLAIGALSIVTFIAGYFPARRATKVDPMVALKYE